MLAEAAASIKNLSAQREASLALGLPRWGPAQQQNFASGNRMEIQSPEDNEKLAHKTFPFELGRGAP